MPPQSRAQRRRQSARQPSRPQAPGTVSAEAASSDPSIDEAISLDPLTMASLASATARAVRPNRRVLTRPVPAPVDYSADYAAVRVDLRWIAIWTGLLFVAMFALYFSGIV